MKHLVVNADDLGADRARNRGIFEAVRGGAVTSVSVLVNGAAFEDCREELVDLARGGLSIGLHLNLSEGQPLTPGLELLAQDGSFLGKWTAHERLEDTANPELRQEVAREIEAQFRALGAAGFAPDHLDGHQHVHIFPAVLPLALAAVRLHGVRWFRVPDQAFVVPNAPSTAAARFATLGSQARPVVEAAGLRCPDRFQGLDLIDHLDRSTLYPQVADLPEGVTELMVHPGYAGPQEGPFSAFSSPWRDIERRTLLHPEFRQVLARGGVILGPFPEALE